MKKWRIHYMNNNEVIVKHMIDYIENKERQLQIDKLSNDQQAKNSIVKSILDELERNTKNEDK